MGSKKDLTERAIDNSTGQDERNVILRTTVYVDEGMVHAFHFSSRLKDIYNQITNEYT